jgi:hypothetical protein
VSFQKTVYVRESAGQCQSSSAKKALINEKSLHNGFITEPFYHAAPAKTKAKLGRTGGSLRFHGGDKVC